jgi:NitT/TauT family transport system substrate-binding protein
MDIVGAAIMRFSAKRSAGGLLIAVLVAACSQGGASTAPTAASSAAATSPASTGGTAGVPGPLEDAVTVRIGVFPNITHAPGLVALADGGTLSKLLPNATIDVQSFNSGTKASEALFADAIDLTFVGPNPAINAYVQSSGEAVRVISGSTSGGAFLVVRPEITDAEGLRGKKIATPSLGNTQDVALRAWLKGKGMATDTAGGGDVSVVPQENSQTLDTFKDGTIDGAWVPEPWATRLIQEAGAKVLLDERDLWPEGKYVTTQLMVATKYLQANPDVVKRVVLATMQAVDEVNEDAATAQTTVNAEIEKFTTKPIGTELLKTAWDNLTFTVDPIASSLKKSADDAHSLDLLDDPGDLSGLYDLKLLNEILKALRRPEVSGL